MRAGIGTKPLSCATAIAAVLTIAQAAAAQDTGSVGDYRLPEPTQTARPTVQGPVDPDNPVGVPSRTPAPAATPAPAPAPTITLPAPTARPSARPSATPAPRATQAAPQPTPSPEAPSSEAAVPLDTTPLPSEPALPAPTATEQGPSPASEGGTGWLIPGIAGALLLAGGAVLMLRRRKSAATAAEEPQAAPPSPRVPDPKPVPPVRASTPPPAPTPPAPPPTVEPLTITTAFRAKAVRLSLVYATLQYELDLYNPGPEPLPPLQVRADLSSAHGSIGVREQLAPLPQGMEVKHSVPALAAGETVTLTGEVRVPLQQIVPVTKGSAHFMVPLVRFCILAPDGTALRRVFTAGPRDPGSNAIASVRLDAGPRNLRDLTGREIEAARGFALDPVGAQG